QWSAGPRMWSGIGAWRRRSQSRHTPRSDASAACAKHYARAAFGPEGDRAAAGARGRRLGELEVAAGEDRAEHDLHLILRERRTDAAPNAAAERQIRRRVGLHPEKALG